MTPAPLKTSARSLALLVALAGAPASVAAQLPGDPIFSKQTSLRGEYLEKTLLDVKATLDRWRDAIGKGDPRRIRDLVVPDVSFSPLAGWLVSGPAAHDSLASFLPRVSALGLTVLDFDASGAMAYVYAGVHYQMVVGNRSEIVQADAAIVLVQRGVAWKIRSYLERPRPDPLP